ncbi:hypothetical protein ACFE04_005488 [Oxalis oulophora]
MSSKDDDDSCPNNSSSSSISSVETLITPLSSSLSNLSSSSRALPYNKDFHFFANFKEFKAPIEQITSSSQFLLEIVGSSSSRLFGANNNNIRKRTSEFPAQDQDFDSEAYDWLVDFNDELFERFDSSIDEFKRMRQIEEEEGRLPIDNNNNTSGGGFQLVTSKKNKKKMTQKEEAEGAAVGGIIDDNEAANSGVKVAERQKAKVPFHVPSITRPQDEYNILVNNSNQPFDHVWLERSADGTRPVHPLEKCSYLDFVDKDATDADPVPPSPLEATPFKVVDEVRGLKELAAKLRAATEFAVDLEHNQYRSFQGLTCLMQISTRTEDFIVDTFKLRVHIGPYLREVFKDPTKKKVMHGADRDVIWLQRDFGIYLCNVFDTGQASKVLKLERNSLEFLLRHYCGVAANKEYQNADWRFRPLPEEMLKYAREDTHYLLYIYDLMKVQLRALPRESENSEDPLAEVAKCRVQCSAACHSVGKLFTHSSGLCEWRDITARTLDESTGYILPNKTLLDIAKQKPFTINKLRGILKSKNPYMDRHLSTILDIIRSAVLNAAEFEPVVQQLKEGQHGDEGSEIDPGTGSGEMLSGVGGNIINGSSNTHLQSVGFSPSAKLSSGATVQVLKKPANAFGLLLGSTGRKPETNKSLHLTGRQTIQKMTAIVVPSDFLCLTCNCLTYLAKEQAKLEQIRSSVNFPFHTFQGQTGRPRVTVKAPPNKPVQVTQPPAPVRSNVGDVIMLEDDSDEEVAGNSELKDTTPENKDNDEGPAKENDNKEDEPMSLDDLSTSFQNSFQQLNESQKINNEKKSDRVLQVKPFDYDAARKEVKFGEHAGRSSEIESGSSKKGGRGKSKVVDEANKEFGQGKRRQAFPATGNRSATFR